MLLLVVVVVLLAARQNTGKPRPVHALAPPLRHPSDIEYIHTYTWPVPSSLVIGIIRPWRSTGPRLPAVGVHSERSFLWCLCCGDGTNQADGECNKVRQKSRDSQNQRYQSKHITDAITSIELTFLCFFFFFLGSCAPDPPASDSVSSPALASPLAPAAAAAAPVAPAAAAAGAPPSLEAVGVGAGFVSQYVKPTGRRSAHHQHS